MDTCPRAPLPVVKAYEALKFGSRNVCHDAVITHHRMVQTGAHDIALVPGQLTDCRRRRHQTTEDLDRGQSSQHDEVAFGDRGDVAPQQVNRKTPPGHSGADVDFRVQTTWYISGE